MQIKGRFAAATGSTGNPCLRQVDDVYGARSQGEQQMANRDVVAIGASAGGVEALIFLCTRLPAQFPAAILITQHLPTHSAAGLDQLLSRAGPLPAKFADHGDLPARPSLIPTILSKATRRERTNILSSNRMSSMRSRRTVRVSSRSMSVFRRMMMRAAESSYADRKLSSRCAPGARLQRQ